MKRKTESFFFYFIFFLFFFLKKSSNGGGAIETEEQWFLLFESFRTGRKNAKRSLKLGDGQLLESFVNTMASGSDILKCSLLVFLQENSVLFLEHETKNMERVNSNNEFCSSFFFYLFPQQKGLLALVNYAHNWEQWIGGSVSNSCDCDVSFV